MKMRNIILTGMIFALGAIGVGCGTKQDVTRNNDVKPAKYYTLRENRHNNLWALDHEGDGTVDELFYVPGVSYGLGHAFPNCIDIANIEDPWFDNVKHYVVEDLEKPKCYFPGKTEKMPEDLRTRVSSAIQLMKSLSPERYN
ncbi:hypothetical protein HOK51_11580 [Candidatus Woesearchaeota archaeon]|jgi:hypothetical protein|nr:hypothetical protein [Candidatus Woesearchaeota archaeon]MBT6520462.1 hypothetical protein [Candidatus Woesearchaeota archaeon]MBT7368574.1 hypothetical protein [Candidatus Woesearchaeota archaeon]